MNNKTLISALLGSVLATPVAGASTTKADPEATELAASGKEKRTLVPTPGYKLKTGRAAIFVRAPAAKVRAAVLDYAANPTIMPQFQKAKVLERKPGSARVYLMLPILKGAANIWTVQQFVGPTVDGDRETIVGRSLQGNVDALDTRWSIRAVGPASCVLTADIHVEPRLPMPPSTIENEAQKAAAQAVLSVRAHAEAPIALTAGKP